MEFISPQAIQIIQAMLAPGLGISAVGLLLLGFSNRYTALINRIRLLNDEKRKFLKVLADGRQLEYAENTRYMSVCEQIKELSVRTGLLRNAILSLLTAIGLFVLASISIGIGFFAQSMSAQGVSLVLFLAGMVSVFFSIVFAASEVRRSYRIIMIEVHAE
jgi:hypothetical protein